MTGGGSAVRRSGTLFRLLEMLLQAREVRGPERLVRLGPLHDTAERSRGYCIQSLSPIVATTALPYEPRIAQHAQVTRDRRPAHRELSGNVCHRRLTPTQAVEDGAPRGIGNGLEGVDTNAHRCHGEVGNELVTEIFTMVRALSMVDCLIGSYSRRNATIGCTSVARRAGIRHAMRPTMTSSAATPPNTAGSRGST